ncbi:MAG: ORF6N domain-containing protein [bacterium]|nr:ORF6N domain-containing protein [bacterium]
MTANSLTTGVAFETVRSKIHLVRGKKVMLDRDLADLYQVKSIALRQQVKRNIESFPDDFMFQLNENEVEILLSQNVIPSKKSLGGAIPMVFTEQGVAMLSSVLKSQRARQVNIMIMRTFVKLREMLSTHKELQEKIGQLERKYDQQFKVVFEAIKHIIYTEENPKRIGFLTEKYSK